MCAALLLASCSGGPAADSEADESVNWSVTIPVAGAQPVADAFTKETGIKVNVLRLSTSELWQRFQTENDAGRNTVDVLSVAAWRVPREAKGDGLLAPFIPNPVNLKGAYPDGFFDPDGLAFTTRVLVVTITYNTKTVPQDKVPTDWTDLLDPFWTGKLAMLDPRDDAASVDAYRQMSLSPKIGWQFFEQLKNQKPVMTGDAGSITNGLVNGEYAAAITFDHTSWTQIKSGAPLAVTYPPSGIGTSLDYNTLSAKAPHPESAKKFLAFLASKPASEILTSSLSVYTPRTDVDPQPAGRPRLADLNLLPRDVEAQSAGFDQLISDFDRAVGRT